MIIATILYFTKISIAIGFVYGKWLAIMLMLVIGLMSL